MKILITLLISLCLTAPAWALNYTSSALIDLSTLTFSGVQVNVTPLITYHAVYQNGLGSDSASTEPGESGTLARTFAGIGSVTTIADPTQLRADVNISGLGSLADILYHYETITALESGLLTASVAYTLEPMSLPFNDPLPTDVCCASTNAQAIMNFMGSSQYIASLSENYLHFGQSTTGFLSLTQSVTAGQSVPLELVAAANVSVPLPSMFWPTAIVLVGLAGFAAWKRRAQA
ncbi:MAG: hypothetical protein ABIO96_00630 [Nitrospiraceae bacterium]